MFSPNLSILAQNNRNDFSQLDDSDEEDFTIQYYERPKPKLHILEEDGTDTEFYAFEGPPPDTVGEERTIHSFYHAPPPADEPLAPQDAIDSFEFPMINNAYDDNSYFEYDDGSNQQVQPVFQPLPIGQGLFATTTSAPPEEDTGQGDQKWTF